MRDAPPGLAPDLRPGGQVVRLRVGRVVVLIGQPPARRRLGEVGGEAHRVVGMLARQPGRLDHHLGAERPQGVDLLVTDPVGDDHHDPVPLLGRHQREPDARVAGGGLDHGPAGPQQPVLLRLLDHAQTDPVLGAAPDAQVLQLRVDSGGTAGAQPDQRGAADEAERRLIHIHCVHHGTLANGRKRQTPC